MVSQSSDGRETPLAARAIEDFHPYCLVLRSTTTLWAHRNGNDAVKLSMQFHVISLLGIRFEIKESIIVVDSCRHEKVEGVMNIIRGEAKIFYRAPCCPGSWDNLSRLS